MKIETLYTYLLRNEEHFEFHTEFYKLAQLYTMAEVAAPLFTQYKAYYKQLDEALEVIRKGQFTENLADIDKQRDTAHTGIRKTVKSYLYHYDDKTLAATKRLDRILSHYGNLGILSRDQQTASVYNLIQDLQDSQDGTDLTTLNLTAWVKQLETYNKKYQEYADLYYSEKELQPTVKSNEARKLIDECYKTFCNYIEVSAEYMAKENKQFEYLISALNPRVAHYRKLINQRIGARKGKDGDGDDELPPIPTSNTGPAEAV